MSVVSKTGVNLGGRPTNASKADKLYLKNECQLVEACLNQLESICKSPNITQKEDMVGTIGLLVGKIMVRFQNIEARLKLFDDSE